MFGEKKKNFFWAFPQKWISKIITIFLFLITATAPTTASESRANDFHEQWNGHDDAASSGITIAATHATETGKYFIYLFILICKKDKNYRLIVGGEIFSVFMFFFLFFTLFRNELHNKQLHVFFFYFFCLVHDYCYYSYKRVLLYMYM